MKRIIALLMAVIMTLSITSALSLPVGTEMCAAAENNESSLQTAAMSAQGGVGNYKKGDTSNIRVTLTAGEYNITKDESGLDVIHMGDFSSTDSPGDPMLPHKVYNIIVPPDVIGSSLQLKVVSAEIRTIEGTYDIKPAGPDVVGADGKLTEDWGEGKMIVGTPIAYLKTEQYRNTDYNLYIYTDPTTIGQHGTLLATDYWSPDGNTVAITAIGMDKIAYLKRGPSGDRPSGDTDYNLYIYTAPTTIGQHGTLIASDYWAPDGDTVAITAIGMDKIAYLKKGAYGAEDYNLYIYTAPTTIGGHGTLIATDYWAPDGDTVAITAIGMDKIAYLKKGAYGYTDYDLYVYTAPTTIGGHGTLIASDYWAPDGQTEGVSALG
jgi:hypothetical protein